METVNTNLYYHPVGKTGQNPGVPLDQRLANHRLFHKVDPS